MSRIIFYAVTVTELLYHFEIKLRSLFNALGFN